MPASAPRPTRARTAPATAMSLAAASYVFAVVMMGTTMPTPLYPIYQEYYGFGSALTTVLFAIYAGGVIVSLVVWGRLSDAVGRRPMLLAGLMLSLASAAVFALTDVEWLLFAGRVLSGLAAGILTATGTVVVMENAPAGGARLAGSLATASNIGGLGLGMLMAGLVAQVAAAPLRAPFVVHAVLLAIGVGALWWVRERGGTPDGAAGPRLRLRLPGVPAEARTVFGVASVGCVAGFAWSGLYSSLVPSFMSHVLHTGDPAAVGFTTFLFFGSSAVAQIGWRSREAPTLVAMGTVSLVVGMALLAAALAATSLPILLVASVCGGAGQGLLFMAGMRAITTAAPAQRRTEIATSYFIVAYLSISLPAIAAGVLTRSLGLTPVAIGFAAVFAALALAGLRWRARLQPATP